MNNNVRVKENNVLMSGHKTRYWCCQDGTWKQKARPSQRESAKHRDTLGMHRYNCQSCLRVSCREINDPTSRQITIYLQHHEAHTPYYDIAMPPEAAAIIRENLEWTTPNTMVSKVQSLFPAVMSRQIHLVEEG